MKHLNLIVLLTLMALSATTLFGQSIQKGFVYEYNDKMEKVPLANVEIVVTNAASTVSDANGEFTLRFRQLKPGDRIIIRRCIKSGYSIADENSLDHLYITGSESQISILLCKTEKLMEVRRNMVRHATEKTTARYEEDQIHLEFNYQQQQITKAEYDAKLEALKQEYENKLDNIDNYIDRFVKLDLTALTAEEQKIMSYVRDGNFEKAIAAYDKLDLAGRLTEQSKNIDRLKSASSAMVESERTLHNQRKNLRNAVLRQADLLRMQGGDDVDEKIGKLIHDLAMVDTTNVYNMLVYARLLLSHAEHMEADRVYRSLIWSSEQQGDSMNYYRAQCYHAVALTRGGNRVEGLPLLEAMLPRLDSIRRSRSDTLSLLRDESEFFNTLGFYYNRLGDTAKANAFFRRCVNDLRSLRAETTLKDLDSQYAVLLSQAAAIMRNQWGDESAEMCKESISILEELYKQKPYVYEGRLAYSYKSLGEIYKIQLKYDEAEEAMLNAEHLYRKAVRRNPVAYNRFLAHCLVSLGSLYIIRKDYNRSLQCLDNARTIFLNEKNGAARFADNLSDINYNIGKCAYFLRDYETALKCDLLALEEMEPLYAKEPKIFYKEMGRRLLHLCNVYVRLKEYETANIYIQRALEVDPNDADIRRNAGEVKRMMSLFGEQGVPELP